VTSDQKPETRDQKPETRNQKPETRKERPETRDQEIVNGIWILRFEIWSLKPEIIEKQTFITGECFDSLA
jgi:hypothetical protein